MSSASDLDPPLTRATAEGWDNFSETILPGVSGGENANAHIAFHFGAYYVLQLLQQIIAERSAEHAALALDMLSAELEEFMKAHAVEVQ
jgi:hypothetical protein